MRAIQQLVLSRVNITRPNSPDYPMSHPTPKIPVPTTKIFPAQIIHILHQFPIPFPRHVQEIIFDLLMPPPKNVQQGLARQFPNLLQPNSCQRSQSSLMIMSIPHLYAQLIIPLPIASRISLSLSQVPVPQLFV